GETSEDLNHQFESLVENGLEYIRSLEDLQILLSIYPPANALRFAVEAAYIHYICQRKNMTVGDYLRVPNPGPVATAFTLPIMAPDLVTAFIKNNNLNRFANLKIK